MYLLSCCKRLSHLPGQLHQVLVFFKAQNLQVQHYYLERQQTIWLLNAPNFEMYTLDFVLLMFIYHKHKSSAAKQITIQKAYESLGLESFTVLSSEIVMWKNAYNWPFCHMHRHCKSSQ